MTVNVDYPTDHSGVGCHYEVIALSFAHCHHGAQSLQERHLWALVRKAGVFDRHVLLYRNGADSLPIDDAHEFPLFQVTRVEATEKTTGQWSVQVEPSEAVVSTVWPSTLDIPMANAPAGGFWRGCEWCRSRGYWWSEDSPWSTRTCC